MMENDKKTVAIVGGGLVGCLQACYMAKRGYTVNIYEKRSDMRRMDKLFNRISVNLTMAVRSIEALREVGLAESILQQTIPMRARMIHQLDGECWSYPYGTKDQCIYSVGRGKLNQILLTEADRDPNVTIFFSHKLASCDFDKGQLTFVHNNEKITRKAELIFGCDGAYSVVRQEMIKGSRVDYSQTYINHGYAEICMPAKKTADGKEEFAMPKNYLHVWPRNEFMLIGMPNQDKSFTGTLCMPFTIFDQLKKREDALDFFQTMFPDAVQLFGEDNLLLSFDKWKVEGPISIKCSPFHYKDRCVLMGDAAHAIVPYYGQGMNSGMEDCLVFKDALDSHPDNMEAALEEYSRNRTVDAHALCDLAMYNYVEMRSKMNSKFFLIRRKLDQLLHWLMPNTWIPLITTVSFTRMPYQKCIDNKAWQDKVVDRVLVTCMVGCAGFSSAALYRCLGHRIPLQIGVSWK